MIARSLASAAVLSAVVIATAAADDWSLPVRTADRRSWREVRLTDIGRFGLRRKARPGIASHLHTGVDIRRPSRDYADEPVYPASRGIVISVRDDGPFAQVIIEHRLADGYMLWTVYEHLAGIRVVAGDTAVPAAPIGRFMTTAELDRHGWQFDHLHFEVLRQRPRTTLPSIRLPMRFFQTYALICRDSATLSRYYDDPETFLKTAWRSQ